MLRRLKRNQKGFTLIELLLVIALTGIIGTAAAMSIHQILTGTVLSNDQNTAINQVQNANHWLNLDVQSATPSSINATPESPKFLSLELEEWELGAWSTHVVDYSLEPMFGTSLKQMWRDYDGQRMPVAQYIDPDNTNCTWHQVSGVLTVTITAQVNTRTETRTFQVKPRPD